MLNNKNHIKSNYWFSTTLHHNSKEISKFGKVRRKVINYRSIFTIAIIILLVSLTAFNDINSQQFRTTETAITLSNEANKELNRFNYLEAISLFKKAIKLNKNYVPARVGLAKAYYYLDNFERALIEIEDARQIDRNSIIVLVWSAKINIKLEEFSRAKEDLDSASYIDARNYDMLMTYAEYYREIGRYKESIRYYDLASGTRENTVEPLIEIGNTYMMLDRTTEAYQAYSQALNRNQRNAKANYSLAKFFYSINDIQKALKYIENAVVIDPYSSEYLELNYLLLFDNGRWSEAENLLKQLITFNNPKSTYYHDLGITLSKQGKYSESIQYLEQGVENFRGDEILRWKAEMISLNLRMSDDKRKELAKYRYDIGIFYRDRNIVDKALLMLDRAIKIDPQNMMYRYQKALIYKEQGYSDRYYKILLFIKGANPDFPNIQNDLEYYERKLQSKLSGKLGIKFNQYEQEKPFKDIRPKIAVSEIEVDKDSQSHYDANFTMQDILYRALSTNDSFSVEVLDKSKAKNETDELNRIGADLVIRSKMKEIGNLLTVTIELQNVYNGVTLFEFEASQRGNNRFLNIALGFTEKIAQSLPVFGRIRDKKEDEVIINIGTLQKVNINDFLYVIGNENDFKVFIRNEENFSLEDKIESFSKAKIKVIKLDERVLKGKIISGDYSNTVNVNNFVLYKNFK